MSFILSKVTIPHVNGLPADAVTNSFALVPAGSATRADASAAFSSELDGFYTSLAAFLSTEYTWNAMGVEYVDLLDARPRLPFSFGVIAGPNTTTANYNLPAEVSCCLSLVGSVASGQNPRRRRGRVYVGPLQMGAQDMQMTGTPLPTAVANAGAALMVNPAYTLCIYSRYTHYGVPVGRRIDEKDANGNPRYVEVPDFLPASFVPVTGVYADNAWDIQRRRGPKPTTRIYGA